MGSTSLLLVTATLVRWRTLRLTQVKGSKDFTVGLPFDLTPRRRGRPRRRAVRRAQLTAIGAARVPLVDPACPNAPCGSRFVPLEWYTGVPLDFSKLLNLLDARHRFPNPAGRATPTHAVEGITSGRRRGGSRSGIRRGRPSNRNWTAARTGEKLGRALRSRLDDPRGRCRWPQPDRTSA